VVAARAAIAGSSDETLLKPWSLLAAGKTLITMPRVAWIRGFVLGVYLRLNDIAVPAIYGPSADERQM